MKQKRNSPDQVVRKLREADRLVSEGADVATICRHLEISEQTYFRWRKSYAGKLWLAEFEEFHHVT